MEQYPANIPLPVLRDGDFQQVPNLQAEQMAGGNIKTVITGHGTPPTRKEFVWRLRKPEAAFFEGWIEHVLGKGIAPFEMIIHTPQGRLPHICKLLRDPRESRTPLGLMFWGYRAEVVIREFATMDEDTTVAQYFAPYDLSELVARLEAAMTGYVE